MYIHVLCDLVLLCLYTTPGVLLLVFVTTLLLASSGFTQLWMVCTCTQYELVQLYNIMMNSNSIKVKVPSNKCICFYVLTVHVPLYDVCRLVCRLVTVKQATCVSYLCTTLCTPFPYHHLMQHYWNNNFITFRLYYFVVCRL